MRGFAAAQAAYDRAEPPEVFDWETERPDEYEAARLELFEEMVGDQCDGVVGHMGPAELALCQFLASCLRVPASTSDSIQRDGLLLNQRVAKWRAEILARIDRDAIEARCERNHESRRADE